MSAILASIILSAYLMFVKTADVIEWLKPFKIEGSLLRQILILTCFTIYFLRLSGTMFVFLQRKMYWIEAIIIVNIMPWLFPYIAWAGGNNDQPVGLIEIGGLALFLCGSYLNTASEYSRHNWKRKQENSGHLYTIGLFKYARNINYFGDILLFAGMAAVAHRFSLLAIPAFMAAVFCMIIIPRKEKYLREKYGAEFDEYASRTRRIVPIFY